jgi:glyoxylate reductase
MPSTRLKVIVTRRLPKPVEDRLNEFFDVSLRNSDETMTRAELVEAVKNCDVLVPTLNDQINAGLIGQAGERLKLIANYGAGVDHIDVHTARQNGILVSNTPGVLTEDTADMTMALILAVTRRMTDGLAQMQSGDWQGWSPTALLGRRITGRRLGIIGMGRIGQAVAIRARAFGMQIHYHDRQRLRPEAEEGFAATYWEELDEMISRMDVISMNCPYTTESYHLMNAKRLKLMKPDAVIVNTSRGELIDENALTRMIGKKEIAGAGLDVFEHRDVASPNLKPQGNVVLLPHMGSATIEGRLEMGERVVLNIKTFDDGHRPPDQVIPAMV